MDDNQIGVSTDPVLGYEQAQKGEFMLTSLLIFFILLLLFVCFHLHARWFLRRARHRNPRRLRLFSRVAASARGLDSSVLNSLPTFVYTAKSSESDQPSCAICFSEFESGELGRVLPKCGHTFHVECIDKWFKSHSNCPLCRALVVAAETTAFRIRNHGESETRSGSSESSPSSVSCVLPMVECPRKKSPEIVGILVEVPGRIENRSQSDRINSELIRLFRSKSLG